MAVVEVPDVEEAVHTGQVEEAWARGRPATIRQIGLVVAGLHDWIEDTFFAPHLGLPVTYTHKVLLNMWVALDSVNRPVMAALDSAEPEVSLDLLLLLVDEHDNTLFCADKELTRTGFVVPLHGSATTDLNVFVRLVAEVMIESVSFDRLIWLPHVPPKDLAIGRSGNAFSAGFSGLHPENVVDRIVMGVLKLGSNDRLERTRTGSRATLDIKEAQTAVVTASNDAVGDLRVVLKRSKG